MNDLIFATHNKNKVKEVRAMTGLKCPPEPNSTIRVGNVISLDEAGWHEDIPEPHYTLEANAREKAEIVYQKTGKDCFAEDTGLEVAALNGEPGVFSARYAGPQKSAADNIALLLQKMEGKTDRRAHFRTVISLFLEGKEFQFEGICTGRIAENPQGENGFGYDPVFIPDGAERTFAEMDLKEKSQFSHRAKAFEKFFAFLREKQITQ